MPFPLRPPRSLLASEKWKSLRHRARKQLSPFALSILCGLELWITVLLLRNIFSGVHEHEKQTSHGNYASHDDMVQGKWNKINAKLHARWTCLGVILVLTGSIVTVEIVLANFFKKYLWRKRLWRVVIKAVLWGILVQLAFNTRYAQHHERSRRTVKFYHTVWREERLSQVLKEALLQPREVARSGWLDVFPRGTEPLFWMGFASPAILALVPVVKVAYRRWDAAQKERENRQEPDESGIADDLTNSTEFTLSFDPRQSLRTRQGIYA